MQKAYEQEMMTLLASRGLIITVQQDFINIRTNLGFIFPVRKGHVINLPGQALDMPNICTFGNHKNTQLPGELKIEHAFLEL